MVDFYREVPRDLEENLQYRIDLRKRASQDDRFRRALVTACKHDVLFWMGAFCWLYEPRVVVGEDGRPKPQVFPMIPWDHQEPAIREIKKWLGVKDIGAEKSRGEGMSWMAVLLALHDWLFYDMSTIGLVSSTEDKSDNPEDSGSLFWKIDWELTKLPKWMAGVKDVDWKRNLSKHTLVNLRNGSIITGYAATGDVARGGRAKWFLMDEMAADEWKRAGDERAVTNVQQVTHSRLFVSTPNGTDGAYYRIMHEPSSMVKIILDWKDNPSRNRGLYRFEKGVPVAVDPVNNPLPPHYNPPSPEVLDKFSTLRQRGFVLEGKLRSPWYDEECARAGATPQSIARELDRDYGGSMYRIFREEFMDQARASVRPPTHRGTLIYHPLTLEPEFERAHDGQVLLWTQIDAQGRPPQREYVVSADISSGLGGSYTSNSVAHVLDLVTREQVLEFASNTIEPDDFADFCIAMAKWFHDAYLGWERNGPGQAFTKRVLQRQYPHIYMRDYLWKRSKTKTKEAGWWTCSKSKEAMFGELNRQVKRGEFRLHSADLVAECSEYVRTSGGKISHVKAISTEDQSSQGEAHGDRVIAIAVGLMVAKDRPVTERTVEQFEMNNPPPNSPAGRLKEYEASLRQDDEWDDRDLTDLAGNRRFMLGKGTYALT